MIVPPANTARPSVPVAPDVRPDRVAHYRALAADELAYARTSRERGGAWADFGVAHGVRRARAYWRMMLSERRRLRRWAARQVAPLDVSDRPVAAEIADLLRHGRAATFALDAAVVIEGRGIAGRVILRMNDRDGAAHVFSLRTIEAAVAAILLRLEPDLPVADLVADALQRAIADAERRLDAVHRWSGRTRPTEDVE